MALLDKIKQNIRLSKDGYICVDEFMSDCLYDDDHGYYRRRYSIGEKGDFITAPEVSQLFGEVIALYIVNQINTFLAHEKKIQLVELGAGKGTLMSDILRVIKNFPEIYNKLQVVIIDVNETLISLQRESLKEHLDIISWVDKIDSISPVTSIMVANEFFDALPIKQFQLKGDIWLERVVKNSPKGLSDPLMFDMAETHSSREINDNSEYNPEAILPAANNNNEVILEVAEMSVAIMHHIVEHIKRYKGLFITFDYGYWQQGYSDTLQSLKGHEYNNVFQHLGEADLTTHVNFNELAFCAQEGGIADLYYMTQAEFLKMMGIEHVAEKLAHKVGDSLKIRQDLSRLLDKSEMGEIFKCLIIEKLK